MILSQKVIIRWNNKWKKHYESKGYKFTKLREEFEVKIEDLLPCNISLVLLKCDYCGKEFEMKYCVINNKNNINEKDACKKCKYIKQQETFFKNNGVTNCRFLPGVNEQILETNNKKYGGNSPSCSKITQQKVEETNLKKYGHKNPMQNKEIQQKVEETNLKRYGHKCCWGNKEIHDKCQINANITMYENVTFTCSTQQRYLYNLLSKTFIHDDYELNYPVDRCMLDIAFPDELFYIEYDGSGHGCYTKRYGDIEEFNRKEFNRKAFLQSQEWKLMRIISKYDWLPSDEVILNLVQRCKDYLNTGHSWIEVDINESVIRSSKLNKRIELGELRKIEKEK